MISFILDKIHLRNVRCYGDDGMEMDFPLNNLTVFTGHVGSGKSTILKAVSLALYGEDGGAKNEKLAIDDIINEKNKKNLEIDLYFHSVDEESKVETKYEIHLFHKHSKYNNRLVFVKDGKDISLESKTATYELIEKTLIPKNVYHNIYYFTQQAKNFFTALPNSEQKDIFNSILDLSEYDDYYENVKNVQRSTENDLNCANVQISADQKNVDTYKQSVQEAINKKSEMEQNVEMEKNNLANSISELEQEIKLQQDAIGNQTLEGITKEISDKKIECEQKKIEFGNEVVKIKKEMDDSQTVFNNAVNALKNTFVQKRNEESKQLNDDETKDKLEIQTLNGEFKNISQRVELEYNAKRENVTKQYEPKIKELTDKVLLLESNIHDLETTELKNLQELQKEAQDNVDVVKKDLTDVKMKIVTCESQKTNFETEITTRETRIKKYQEDLKNPDAVCSLCGQKLTNKDHVQKHIDELSEGVKQFSERLTQVNGTINQLNSKKVELESKLLEIKEDFETSKKSIVEKEQRLKSEVDKEIKSVKDLIESTKKERDDQVTTLYNEEPEVKKTQTTEIDAKIRKLNTDLTFISQQKSNIDDKLRQEYKVEYQKLNAKLQSDFTAKQQLLDGQNAKIKEIDDKYGVVLKQLESKLAEVKKAMSNIDTMKQNIAKLTADYENLGSEHYYDVINSDIEGKKKLYLTQMDVVKKDQQKLKEIQEKYDILEFWRVAFSDSGIKSMLIDAAIPHMNECVSKELEFVAPGKFSVSFDTLSETKSGKIKDKFNINIVNNERGSTGHKKLSGGEKRIIDLCCMSALRSLAEKLYNKRFCHIFYDEILDSLDEECKQQFCENIRRQSSGGCNVTLVTHDCPQDCEPDRVFPF